MAAAPSLLNRAPDTVAAALAAPLPPEAIQPHPTKDYLSSVKAIYVIERLNQVFGLGGWTYRTRIVESSQESPMVVMLVILSVPAYGIRLEQYGGSDNKDRGDAYKGAVTDALSKIGSYLGIAMDVYKGGGPTKRNPRGMAVARSQYTPAQRAIIEGKLTNVLKTRTDAQPAAQLAAAIPAPHEDDTRYTYTPAEDEPSDLEIQMGESIAQIEEQKARRGMLAAFAEIEQRYRAIAYHPTFGAILGRYSVRSPEEFSDIEEARACHREMSYDLKKREAQYAQKWGAK